MVVPTADTVRFSYLLETCLDVGRGVLFTGVTGVGKSVIIGAALQSLAAKGASLPADGPSSRVAGRLLAHTVVFSAQTSSSDVQGIIEGKLEKKRKKRCVCTQLNWSPAFLGPADRLCCISGHPSFCLQLCTDGSVRSWDLLTDPAPH